MELGGGTAEGGIHCTTIQYCSEYCQQYVSQSSHLFSCKGMSFIPFHKIFGQESGSMRVPIFLSFISFYKIFGQESGSLRTVPDFSIALLYQKERSHNDTAPYDNVLTRLTKEIEDALGSSR